MLLQLIIIFEGNKLGTQVNIKVSRIKAYERPFFPDFIDDSLMKHGVKLQILFSTIMKIVRKYRKQS